MEPGTSLLTKNRQDNYHQRRNHSQQQQEKRASLDSPIALPQFVGFNDAESFDQTRHHLRPGQQRSAKPEQKPFPGMHSLPREILHYHVFASRRENQSQALRQFPHGAVKRISAAQNSQHQKQHGEKCQEHVERDRLAQSHAVGENARKSAEQTVEHSVHIFVRRIIRGVTSKRAHISAENSGLHKTSIRATGVAFRFGAGNTYRTNWAGAIALLACRSTQRGVNFLAIKLPMHANERTA
jgi:hypothetical protein